MRTGWPRTPNRCACGNSPIARYYALGRGTIRADSHAVDLHIGRRVRALVPLQTIATVLRPSWGDVPAAGEPARADYRNLTKPATPNVLVTLEAPMIVHLLSAIAQPVRRVGLCVDDPDGFIGAVELARAAAAGQPQPTRS